MEQRGRRHLSAWTVSVAVHAALLGILVWVLEKAVPGPSVHPDPLVYVEPVAPPPPPPPAADVAPLQPEPPPDPAPVERRLVEPTPKPRPKRPEPPRPAPSPPAGAIGGVPDGVRGGTTGGEVGGQPGGTVGGRGDAPVPAALVATPPVVVSRVAPAYPPGARARSLEALVVLRAVVDRDGRVEPEVAVIQSAAPFDEAAVAAIRQWRFTPGRDRDGHLVRVLLEVPVRFRLR